MRDEIVHLVVGVTDLSKALAVHDLVKDTRCSEMRGEVVGIVLLAVVPPDEGAAVGRYDEIGGYHCGDQLVGAMIGTGGGKEPQAEEGGGSASFAHGCYCCWKNCRKLCCDDGTAQARRFGKWYDGLLIYVS